VAHLDVPALCTRADALLAGQFPLLGFPAAAPPRALAWGPTPDWHTDILTGRTAPRVHWTRVPYLDEVVVGDHKITWELNRHQWLVWLALAARATNESTYEAAIHRHLAHWLHHNPRGVGINWASSLEVAFRSIAWTWALHIAPRALPEALARDVFNALHAHGRHVERWLSTWFSPNTHLTGEALALLYLGVAWPQLPRAASWRAQGWQILCEQAAVQLRPDGTYFEQTGWYQAYTVDFYLHALWLAEHARLRIPAIVRERTHAAARALRAMTRRDGRVVRWGDDDGGRLLPLAPVAYGDVRDTLAFAAVQFDDASLLAEPKPVVDAVLWHLGPDAASTLGTMHGQRAATPDATVLADGGWVVLRSSALEVFMDAGPHAALSGAHAHADALALEVTVNGRVVLADPGTFRYMGDGRDALRATSAHNAVTAGDHSSAVPSGPFRWARTPVTHITAASCDAAPWFVQARHDGFVDRGLAATWREVRLLREDALLVIDWVSGAPAEPLAVHWRPPIEVRAECTATVATLHDAGSRALRAPALATIVIPSDWQLSPSVSPWSAGYGVRDEVVGVSCRPLDSRTTACCTLLLAGDAPRNARITRADTAADAPPAWHVVWGDVQELVTPASFR
jgi:hypothetical protein